MYDRTRGNRRNWYGPRQVFSSQFSDEFCACFYLIPGCKFSCRILAWEDGFCNFAASACDHDEGATAAAAAAYTECASAGQEELKGLQPELFFKMSHDIYNYGEG
jgi:hypothetical protein